VLHAIVDFGAGIVGYFVLRIPLEVPAPGST
jgi:hypothetical protein